MHSSDGEIHLRVDVVGRALQIDEGLDLPTRAVASGNVMMDRIMDQRAVANTHQPMRGESSRRYRHSERSAPLGGPHPQFDLHSGRLSAAPPRL
jgi:hypothetical protein